MFTTLINRNTTSSNWQKIPWHDPDFSRRMLVEHLNQAHDLASRRLNTIDEHVQWIQHKILNQQSARILDLGCGPGFYMRRFAKLGHSSIGVDISPASIEYAREHDSESKYILGDVRELDYGEGYDLVTMIYGELNAFQPSDAARIINKAYAALKPGGKLLLEVHHEEAIHRYGDHPAAWHTAEQGLFSDEPYLCLTESQYETDHAISQYYVYAADSGELTQYTAMHQAYSDDEYRHLLEAFGKVSFYPALNDTTENSDLFVIVAEK